MVLPVIIAAISFAAAGFVAPRTVMYTTIDNVYVAASDFSQFQAAGYGGSQYEGGEFEFMEYDLEAMRGYEYPFAQYFTVVPAMAKNAFFSNPKNFKISNPDAVKISDGKIQIWQHSRYSDNGRVSIEAEFGGRVWFRLDIYINGPTNRLDYFGFNYDILRSCIASEPALIEANVDTYARVTNANQIEIFDRAVGFTVPLALILQYGLDTAPGLVLLTSSAFINSLRYNVIDGAEFLGNDGKIKGFGVATVEITTTLDPTTKQKTTATIKIRP